MSARRLFIALFLLVGTLFGMSERRVCAGLIASGDEISAGFQRPDDSSSGTSAESGIDALLNDHLPHPDLPPEFQSLFALAPGPQQSQQSTTSSSVTSGSPTVAFAAFTRDADQPPPLMERAVEIAECFHPRLVMADIFRPPRG